MLPLLKLIISLRSVDRKYLQSSSGLQFDVRRKVKGIESILRKEQYRMYLASKEWKKRRARVMDRDNYLCRICGKRATEVHHLTYDRIFDEPLYDLVAICRECHEVITEMKKA